MSNTRYFEIVSTYRNRIQFPDPASFDVLIAQTGTRSQFDAYDPVSDAAPLITWNIPTIGNGFFVTNSSNTLSRFLVKFPILQLLNKLCDYYIGMPITIATTPTIISGWEYSSTVMTDDYFFITVFPLSTLPTTGAIAIFNDPTNNTLGLFYIPNSVPADGFYTNYILWNETQKESVKILTYNGNNHIAGVDATKVSGWVTNDTLSIRKKPPIFWGTINSAPAPTSIAKFILPSTASNIPNEYVNNFIYFTTGANKGKSYRVISYTGIPVPCPPPQPFDPYGCPHPVCVLPPDYQITLDIPPTYPPSIPPSIPMNNDVFEILQFTRDNVVPFTYTGSTVSQQQMVCYEVELINLVLPNLTLKTGGRVAFYPYVYVELQNITGSSGGNTNIIYSNNPNSVRRLFRAAIDDIPNPLISPFIKIDGDGMTQTIKFKPNDSFKFGVYLSDGTLFETVYEDSYGPAPANPLVQISAMFSMKRVG
jgi:hypothetical protein